ncbi:MAG: acetate--CoA ligase family protein [Actinomycetia bacterium]|nr:acetate--CoA ligase family protein [Actinomycetes bacterium]
MVERSPERIAAVTETAELTEDAALKILRECGIQTPRQERVATPVETVAAAATFGGPVVIRAVADGLLHKSDLGLVVTNVVGADAVQLAAREVLYAASAAGLRVELLVVEQIAGSLDVVVGYKRDPQFGPTAIVGLGGVWAEMLESSHGGHMMPEARGGALDVIDVNPIIVGRDRAVAVDAVIERAPTSSLESITLDAHSPAHATIEGATQ